MTFTSILHQHHQTLLLQMVKAEVVGATEGVMVEMEMAIWGLC
jgi:hypothetical protein